ncbi:MAG: hypothetical protein L6R39_002233 [Caloplaca ligustica]|nr:MAG: hypothetical protein L6R39_002233 [Caloplaca ligustica]
MDFSDDIYGDPQKMFKAMAGANPNLPAPKFLSFQESRRVAKQYSQDIFTAQQVLVHILDRHEETLIKRWLKKTTSQRQKVLTAALPGIPPTHRPDFWAIRKENLEQLRGGTQYRDHWLLPSINLEDLSKPKNLLLFLRSRARNPPGVFVNADANSVHVAHTAQALMPPYLSGYTMLFAGQNSQQAYGRMVSWDDDDGAFDMMSSGIGLQPGEGLQVMEIQQRKMQFLQRCTELILQDLSLKDTGIAKEPVPPDDLLAKIGSEWPSLAQEIEEAPYRVPDPFDIARLRTFVVARRNEAEDHIWSLREDPSYFQDAALSWSEHRQEKILTASGKTHPVLRQDLFWERVLSNLVVDAYADLVSWDAVMKDLDQLEKLKSKQLGQARQNQELPGVFSRALAHFEYFLDQLIKGPVGNWKVSMVASPPLRQHYVREPQDPNTTRIIVTSKDTSRKKSDHLLWLLETFLDEDRLFLCGLENVCDELEREIRSNQTSRERISPYIANFISDLSLFGEIKRQIGLTTPGPRMIELIEKEEKQAGFSRKIDLFSQVYNTLTALGKGLAEVGSPLERFSYPSHKRRTSATTRAMQQAERNLDVFWNHVDDHCKKTAGKSIHEMIGNVLKERPLQRTPDWVEHDSKPKHSTQDSEPDATTSKLATLELQLRTEKTLTANIPPQGREKPKTRGVPRSSSPTAPEPLDTTGPTSEEDVTPVFKVSKRGFKVFTTLFYTPSEEEPPGEIPWSEFLSAMASVGFSIQKLDGSAWVFAPAHDAWKQSIIFHEPHPSSKIPFQVARRFGRRLWRTYGWSGENFQRA